MNLCSKNGGEKLEGRNKKMNPLIVNVFLFKSNQNKEYFDRNVTMLL